MDRAAARLVLLLVVLAALPAAPAAAAEPAFSVAFVGGPSQTTPVAQETTVFYFDVTNHGDAADYFVVPRSEMRWTAGGLGTAAGLPTPEFGRALGPGETGRMAVRLDVAERRAGDRYVAEFPVVSERTGERRTLEATILFADIPVEDAARPPAALTSAIRVTEATVRAVDVPDSIWHLGASADLRVVLTAPMTHPGPAAFHAVVDGEARWSVPFDAVGPPKDRAGQFQALDTKAAVSPDGRLAAGIDWHGRVHVIEAATGNVLWSADQAAHDNPHYPETSMYRAGFFGPGMVAFSADGQRLAVGGTNGHVALFASEDGTLLWSRDFSAEVRGLAFTPDGARLAVGPGDWRFHMLDAADGTTLWTGGNEFWPLDFTSVSPDGARVAAGGKDGVVRVWDVATGEQLWSDDYRFGFVSAVAFADDGRVFVSDWKNGVHAYDAEGRRLWHAPMTNANLDATADGRFVFVAQREHAGERGVLRLLDGGNGAELWRHDLDLDAHCQDTKSPFQRGFAKQAHVVAREDGRLSAVASCIGGSVFFVEIGTATGGEGGTAPSAGTGDEGMPAAPRTPRPTENGQEAPAAPVLVGLAALMVVARSRRR